MKHPPNLDNLHIGNIIKKIALNKGISSSKIADLICRYENNSNKIYRLDDMDIKDVVQISYLLEYNFLKTISDEYLSYLPPVESHPEQERYYIEWDMQTNHFSVSGDFKSKDTFQKIHVGQYIKNIADKKGWNGQYMAKLLNCTQGNISNLYGRKSLTIKKLIQVSNVLKQNLIAEVYLNRMFIISSPTKFAHCMMTITPQEIRIENMNDRPFLMIFCRKYD